MHGNYYSYMITIKLLIKLLFYFRSQTFILNRRWTSTTKYRDFSNEPSHISTWVAVLYIMWPSVPQLPAVRGQRGFYGALIFLVGFSECLPIIYHLQKNITFPKKSRSKFIKKIIRQMFFVSQKKRKDNFSLQYEFYIFTH